MGKKTFLINDMHFGHEMTLLFVPRPFIRGNHDRSRWMKRYAVLKRGDHSFFLVHDPDDRAISNGFAGWVIHGHHHGGRDKFGNEYPFIDGVKRRINVVCELTDYKPVDLDWLVGLNLAAIKRMDTVNSEPILWASPSSNPAITQSGPMIAATTPSSSKPPEDLPRKALAKIVSQYGKEIVTNPQRCEGLLRDICKDHQREIFVLTSVQKRHVPEELLSHLQSVPRDILIRRLAERTSNEFGFAEGFALWAVVTWALALSLITPEEAAAIEL